MLDLCGEPLAEEVQLVRGKGPQKTAQEIAAINVAKREYQKAYMDYWNSTATVTGTGRPVDAFMTAVAPWAAVMPSKYTYLAYTTFVNVLDYTSAVIRVTTANKEVDVVPSDYEPLSDEDKVVYDNCELTLPRGLSNFPVTFSLLLNGGIRLTIYCIDDPQIYHGAPVGLQLVGRRFQEEKMLALAEYISGEIDAQ